MTFSNPERDPRGRIMTLAHLVYLPSQALDLVKPGPDGREPIIIDVDFKPSQCFYEGRALTAEDFAFDHYEIVTTSIQRIQGRMKWNPTFLNLLRQPVNIYTATELVNVISPDKKIVHNNFFVQILGNLLRKLGKSGGPNANRKGLTLVCEMKKVNS
ncbi:hypothetical protein ACS6Z8_00170 [Streptococcus suis]